MRRIVSFLFFLFLVTSTFSQGIDNLWMMGYESNLGGPPFGGININFLNGSPAINYISRPMYFGDISATMCDTGGNVLFYTN